LDDPLVEKHELVRGERYLPLTQGPVHAVFLLDGQAGPSAELELAGSYTTARGSFFLIMVLGIFFVGVVFMRSHQSTATKWKVELSGENILTEHMMGSAFDMPAGDELRTG